MTKTRSRIEKTEDSKKLKMHPDFIASNIADILCSNEERDEEHKPWARDTLEKIYHRHCELKDSVAGMGCTRYERLLKSKDELEQVKARSEIVYLCREVAASQGGWF